MNEKKPFSPIKTRLSRPFPENYVLLLLIVSLWGLLNQLTRWNQPIDLVFGTVDSISVLEESGSVRYRLIFTIQETGEALNLWLHNGGPVLDYLLESPPTDTIAVRYWIRNATAFELHPLVFGVEPIRDPVPPLRILVATSIGGLLVSFLFLFPDLMDRVFYGSGRPLRRR